jgi:hypothetical protein
VSIDEPFVDYLKKGNIIPDLERPRVTQIPAADNREIDRIDQIIEDDQAVLGIDEYNKYVINPFINRIDFPD